MLKIAYHASHEQFDPATLHQWVIKAEKAGFNAFFCSDHFHPWDKSQGHSGFSFAWLGAALQATSLPGSTIVAPGQRYHPAIVAQAVATLNVMFPGRFEIALGSGEALNELITGERWPGKKERNQRLLESAEIMRSLWRGEEVTHSGSIKIENATLYTRPSGPIKIYGAAVSYKTAQWLGQWADGLLTINQKDVATLQKMVSAFQDNQESKKPMILKVQLSYARDEQQALEEGVREWKYNIFEGEVLENLWPPDQFQHIAKYVKAEDVKEKVRISSDLDEHIEWLKSDIKLGFDHIVLHKVSRQQEPFIEDFGKVVLPALKKFKNEL